MKLKENTSLLLTPKKAIVLYANSDNQAIVMEHNITNNGTISAGKLPTKSSTDQFIKIVEKYKNDNDDIAFDGNLDNTSILFAKRHLGRIVLIFEYTIPDKRYLVLGKYVPKAKTIVFRSGNDITLYAFNDDNLYEFNLPNMYESNIFCTGSYKFETSCRTWKEYVRDTVQFIWISEFNSFHSDKKHGYFRNNILISENPLKDVTKHEFISSYKKNKTS
jgi:hypothetical protein